MSADGVLTPRLAAPVQLQEKSAPIQRSAARFYLALAVGMGCVTWIAHGWTLDTGLFLDDHWHRVQLCERGWSLNDLLESSPLDTTNYIEIWWQTTPVRWQYARPVAVVLTKITHWIGGGNVAAQHAVSLILHAINATLVCILAFWLTRHRFWTVIAGLTFAVYSHAIFAIGWIAAQNALLQTGFMLGALLLYIRSTGLDVGPERHSSTVASFRAAGRSPGLFAVVVVLWLVALLSRENAMMFPIVLVALDLSFGGWRRVRSQWGAYLILAVLGTAYLVWRFGFYFHPMPGLYARRGNVDGYALWWIAKLIHYLCSAVWLSPMMIGPTGRYHPFREAPADMALMAGIVAVMFIGYIVAARRARGWWIWPVWIVLTLLPVVPILAAPHQGYACGVGFAIALVMGPALGGRDDRRGRRWSWSSIAAIWLLLANLIYVPIYRTLWKGMMAAERYPLEALAKHPAPATATDIYFINLPLLNIYTKVCLEDAWGPTAKSLRCHALTFAPGLLGLDGKCAVDQVDDRTFRATFHDSPSFSGLLGRFLIEGMHGGDRLVAGQVLTGPDKDVRVVAADESGVTTLEFRFHEPLASPRYAFYLGSALHPALPIHFRTHSELAQRPSGDPLAAYTLDPHISGDLLAEEPPKLHDVRLAAMRLESGRSGAATCLFRAMAGPDGEPRRVALERFGLVGGWVAEATGAPEMVLFESQQRLSDGWQRAAAWWMTSIDDDDLRETWLHRDDAWPFRDRRLSMLRARDMAARVIRSDLFLTGPPFPGPR